VSLNNVSVTSKHTCNVVLIIDWITNQPTHRQNDVGVFLENVIAKLVKFHALLEPEGSLPFIKHPPLVPILSQVNSVHTFPTLYAWVFRLIYFLPSKILYAFFIFPMCVTCPPSPIHSTLFHYRSNIW